MDKIKRVMEKKKKKKSEDEKEFVRWRKIPQFMVDECFLAGDERESTK